MLNNYSVSFGNYHCIVTNSVVKWIGKLFGVIKYFNLVATNIKLNMEEATV